MDLINMYDNFTATERDTFQRACRRLLKQTFIVRDRNEESRKLYFFVSKNTEPFSVYFRMIGFDIMADRENGVIMLRNYADEAGEGRLRSNRLQLKKIESVILCCLWTIYADHLREGNLTRPILVSVADLRLELEKYGIRDEMDKGTLKKALDVFTRYQLVEVSGNIGDADCLIRLYPSLEFALDTVAFKEMAEAARKRMTADKGDIRAADASDDEEDTDEDTDADEAE